MRTHSYSRLIARLTASLVVLVSCAFIALYVVWSSYRQATFAVCEMVETNYFKSGEEFVQQWLQRCRERAAAQPIIVSRQRTISEINSLLSELGVSHLSLFTPQENKAMWENEAVDTGLRAVNIEGELVVHEVIAGSVGESAKIQRGDKIVLINDQPVGQADYVSWMPGFFTIERKGERFSVNIVPQALSVDLKPTLNPYESKTAVLRIQSFLSQYFSDVTWLPIAKQLANYDHIIVDLRGNVGGSFPAMLRVASSFYCQPETLGTLEKNAEQSAEANLQNDLSAESQIRQMENVTRMHLKTFSGYPCFRGKATILVDSTTASTAEIFAEAMMHRSHARVWGMPTAAQVVMARWFPFTYLGEGDYSLSIPIAGYRARSGAEIEDDGVNPTKLLSYRLNDAIAGKDSWLIDSSTF